MSLSFMPLSLLLLYHHKCWLIHVVSISHPNVSALTSILCRRTLFVLIRSAGIHI